MVLVAWRSADVNTEAPVTTNPGNVLVLQAGKGHCVRILVQLEHMGGIVRTNASVRTVGLVIPQVGNATAPLDGGVKYVQILVHPANGVFNAHLPASVTTEVPVIISLANVPAFLAILEISAINNVHLVLME